MRRKLYALFIKNGINYDLSDDIKKYADYLAKTQDIELVASYKDSNLPTKHKDFEIFIKGGDVGEVSKTAWGLDGIKEQIRRANLVELGSYHIVFFIYELDQHWNSNEKPLGAWTYPNDLNQAAFVEIPSLLWWEQIDSLFRLLTHEGLHAEHRIAWSKGIPTNDTMDLYDKEFQVFAEDGNRARNIKALEPYVDRILDAPPQWKIFEILKSIVAILTLGIINLKKKPEPPIIIEPAVPPLPPTPPTPEEPKLKISRIRDWALAIQKHEGYFPPGTNPNYPLGTLSYRNNNPGNIKLTDYTAKYLGAKPGIGGFARFDSYLAGFNALMQFLKHACEDRLIPYKGNPTLFKFFEAYCEDIKSTAIVEPVAYALFVASQLKVDPNVRIKELY